MSLNHNSVVMARIVCLFRQMDVPLTNTHIVSPRPFISNTVKSSLIDHFIPRSSDP